MPENPQIFIKLVRDEDPNSHVDFEDFASFLNAIRNSVSHVKRCVGGSEIKYEVDGLSLGSAAVGITAKRSADFDIETAVDIFKTYTRTLKAIEGGNDVDERLDYGAIKSFSGFATVINRGNKISDDKFSITSRFATHLKSMLEKESPARGSVSGRLEQVSIHKKHAFTLYPPIHGESIECTFDNEILPKVLEAVGRHVTVFGELFYSQRKVFPSKVIAESFEIHPVKDSSKKLLEIDEVIQPRPGYDGGFRMEFGNANV